jgi:hypothetical protein
VEKACEGCGVVNKKNQKNFIIMQRLNDEQGDRNYERQEEDEERGY